MPPPTPSRVRNVWVGSIGMLALIYLLNPTAGVFELIPDNFPIIGNLDEAAAVTLILAALRHYGLDLTRLLSGKQD
jgi:uncharacterized membrane protein YkvA (DUF1232 family)